MRSAGRSPRTRGVRNIRLRSSLHRPAPPPSPSPKHAIDNKDQSLLRSLKTGSNTPRSPCAHAAHLESSVDQVFLKQALEDPPHALHEAWVQRFVIVLKVYPPPNALHDGLPLFGVAHHDAAALLVVGANAHIEHILPALHVCARRGRGGLQISWEHTRYISMPCRVMLTKQLLSCVGAT